MAARATGPLTAAQVQEFETTGVLFGVQAVPPPVAAANRAAFEERAAAEGGAQPHYLSLHTEDKWAWDLCTSPSIVNAAAQLLDTENVFMLATHAFCKLPNTTGFVGWHQDLMYWGLGEEARVVSAWIAIDDSSPDNGCMRAVAGSHLTPRVPHGTSEGGDNMLSISQDIDPVHFDESVIVDLVLEPGQASFHHGWVIHGSRPNPSNRRRLGITCIFAPGEIAYDTVSADEATRKSMHSALSSTTTGQGDQTKKPWSEGYLVKGTGGASAVKPLRHPFPYEAPKL